MTPGTGCPTPLSGWTDRKSTRLNSSHGSISYAVFCLKKKKNIRLSTGATRVTKPEPISEKHDRHILSHHDLTKHAHRTKPHPLHSHTAHSPHTIVYVD